MSCVLDLSNPKARQAYDDLVKLDTRKADELVALGDEMIGGRPAKLDEQIRSRSNALKGSFGPITLLSMVSSSETRHGSFDSTSRGKIDFNRTRLDNRYFGIISNLWLGDKKLSRELIETKEEGKPSETHYRLKYHVEDDRITTRGSQAGGCARCVGRTKRVARQQGAAQELRQERYGHRCLLLAGWVEDPG